MREVNLPYLQALVRHIVLVRCVRCTHECDSLKFAQCSDRISSTIRRDDKECVNDLPTFNIRLSEQEGIHALRFLEGIKCDAPEVCVTKQ
jgi:hypothetical protein